MDIEKLKELREETEQYRAVADDRCMSTNYEDDLLTLIDEAISRQSVKSEDVRIALTWFEELDKHEIVQRIKICPDYTCTMPDHVVQTILTALQAYQPWVSVEVEKPESGKHVLLCCEIKPLGKRYVCDGFYAQSKTITTICDGDNNYEYDEETDEYYLIEGYYEIIKNWDDYSSIVIDDFVTHWKPLPEAPKGE